MVTYNGMTVDKKALPGDYDAFEQVSCDWWTPGHVTSILLSDWLRADHRTQHNVAGVRAARLPRPGHSVRPRLQQAAAPRHRVRETNRGGGQHRCQGGAGQSLNDIRFVVLMAIGLQTEQ